MSIKQPLPVEPSHDKVIYENSYVVVRTDGILVKRMLFCFWSKFIPYSDIQSVDVASNLGLTSIFDRKSNGTTLNGIWWAMRMWRECADASEDIVVTLQTSSTCGNYCCCSRIGFSSDNAKGVVDKIRAQLWGWTGVSS